MKNRVRACVREREYVCERERVRACVCKLGMKMNIYLKEFIQTSYILYYTAINSLPVASAHTIQYYTIQH